MELNFKGFKANITILETKELSEDYLIERINEGYVINRNSEETEKTISFDNKDVGFCEGKHKVEYVWENVEKEQNNYEFKLLPHQSVLLKIEKAKLI